MVNHDPANPSVVDSILKELAVTAEVFEIELSKTKLTFKPSCSYAEVNETLRIAWQYVKKAKEGVFKYDLFGADDDTLRTVSLMAQSSVDPKLSEPELLKLAGKGGYVFLVLKTAWDRKMIEPTVEAEADEVENLKND